MLVVGVTRGSRSCRGRFRRCRSAAMFPRTSRRRTSPSRTRCPPRTAPPRHRSGACSCTARGNCHDNKIYLARFAIEKYLVIKKIFGLLTVLALVSHWTWRIPAWRGWSRGWPSPGRRAPSASASRRRGRRRRPPPRRSSGWSGRRGPRRASGAGSTFLRRSAAMSSPAALSNTRT